MDVTSLLVRNWGLRGSYAHPLPLRQAGAVVLLVYFGRSAVANSSIPR